MDALYITTICLSCRYDALYIPLFVYIHADTMHYVLPLFVYIHADPSKSASDTEVIVYVVIGVVALLLLLLLILIGIIVRSVSAGFYPAMEF